MASFCPSTVQLVGIKIMGGNQIKTNNKNPSIFVCKTQVLSSNPNPFPQSTEVKTSNFKQQNNTEHAKGCFSPSLPVLSEPSLRSTRSQGYLRDARTEVIPCSPLGTLWQPSQKTAVFLWRQVGMVSKGTALLFLPSSWMSLPGCWAKGVINEKMSEW